MPRRHTIRGFANVSNQEGLHKSRVGGWRIIFLVKEEAKELYIVTMERRGQVYKRL